MSDPSPSKTPAGPRGRKAPRRARIVRRLAVSVLLTLSVCWYFGIHSPSDVAAYYGMSRECHPVWKELALRRVHAGQSVADVIAATAPLRVQRHGPYTT